MASDELVLVPREPTPEMNAVRIRVNIGEVSALLSPDTLATVWYAMLAAAPAASPTSENEPCSVCLRPPKAWVDAAHKAADDVHAAWALAREGEVERVLTDKAIQDAEEAYDAVIRKEGLRSPYFSTKAFRKAYAAALAALQSQSVRPQAAELQGWQPIKTAPRTSRAILVWVPENQCVFAVTWSDKSKRWEIFGGGWRSFLGDGGGPSHWMPLPPPPADAILALTGEVK